MSKIIFELPVGSDCEVCHRCTISCLANNRIFYKIANNNNIVDEIKYISDGVDEYDEFSGSVSLYGDHVLVGSQYDDDLDKDYVL